jgi:hypothetical protein
MAGINRLHSLQKFESRSTFLALGVKCVFLSHQKADGKEAKKIADYLLSLDIDVYFDEYDKELISHHQSNNPLKVTESILKGINNSTHMLVLVSPSTIKSQWVPFEIGYGYGKTDLSIICLSGIPKGGLPEYIRTAKIIRDLNDLDSLIPRLTNSNVTLLKEQRKLFSYEDINHPLRFVLDVLINDQY